MKRFRFLCAMMLALSVVLVACGGGGKTSSAPAAPKSQAAAEVPKEGATAAASAPREMTKVKMAVSGKGSIIYLPPAVAEYKGFFKEEGIEVEVENVKGGNEAIQKLAAGEIDFASGALEHAVKYQAQGVELVMVALYTRYPGVATIVDTKLKDKVKTAADLKGMTIGVTSINSGTHKATLSLLAKFGLQAADVKFVGVGTSGAVEELTSGKVQAVTGLDPWMTQLVSQGKAYVLWDLRTKKDTEALYNSPDYAFVGLLTRRDVIQKNPDLVQRMARAVVKGNKYITTAMPEEVAAVMPADLKGVDDPLYVASLRANLEAFSPDGLVSDKGVQVVIDALKADKVIPDTADIKVAQVFDRSFAKKG